jgi:hypothetical protein
MNTFLPRVEKPRNPMMKMVYAMDRRMTGKVTAPIAVFAVRGARLRVRADPGRDRQSRHFRPAAEVL